MWFNVLLVVLWKWGVVFSHQCPKWIFIILPSFYLRKNTLNWYITCHVHINIHHSYFIGPIKINRTVFLTKVLTMWKNWRNVLTSVKVWRPSLTQKNMAWKIYVCWALIAFSLCIAFHVFDPHPRSHIGNRLFKQKWKIKTFEGKKGFLSFYSVCMFFCVCIYLCICLSVAIL